MAAQDYFFCFLMFFSAWLAIWCLKISTFVLIKVLLTYLKDKADLNSCVSRLETQLSQLLNDNLALQGQCNALTACIKFLEDSKANSTALSIFRK